MKLLVFSTNGVIHDGITSWLSQSFSLMDRPSIEVHTVAFEGTDKSLIETLEAANVRVHTLPPRKRNLVAYLAALRRLIRTNAYDLVHVNGSSATLLLELLCCWGAGTRARIAHSHNTRGQHPWLHKALRPAMNALCTDRFACGQDAGRWLFGDAEFTVIPNGRDFATYSFNPLKRDEVRGRLGLSDGQIAIGHVGNFNDQKNHRFLIESFAAAHKRNSDLRLFLIGDGALRPAMESLVHDLGVHDAVAFVGRTGEVADYLNAFDLAVLPSLYEGLPNVVIEWQVSGLPSLISSAITDECAVTELVTFVPIGDPAAWAAAITSARPVDRVLMAETAQDALRAAGFEAHDGAAQLHARYLEIAVREGVL